MVISVIPTNEYFEKKVLYIPSTVSWEIELRRTLIELEAEEVDELDCYWTYGLYLKTTDGVNSCLFHSELIENQVEELEADDEDVTWLFDELLNAIYERIGKALAEKVERVDLGVAIDKCLEDWTFHINWVRKQEQAE